MKRFLGIVNTFLFLALTAACFGQTFEIPGQSAPSNQKAPSKGRAKAAQSAPSDSGGIGWGNSIEVGRMARAAEDALKHGNYAAAASFAQRAAQDAPNNAKLWFLAGYAARMAGQLSQSVDAYRKGLAREPNSPDGLSGLAQTYAKAGNTGEAIRMLQQVTTANPKRVNDLLVLGELYIKINDLQQGVQVLQRAESQQPSAHAELLMAMAYMRLKEPDKAKQLLDTAKRRAPNNPEIFRAVANYYREEHDYKGAIETLKSVPHPTPDVLADLGYSYELDGDKQESAKAYSEAATAQPGEIKFQLSAAQANLNAGAADDGKRFLDRAAKIDANHYRLHAIRAALAKSEDRKQDAITEYNFALAHVPESVPEGALYPVLLRMNLADLYRETGNDSAAQQQLAAAEQLMAKVNVEGPAKAEFLRVRASLKMSREDYTGAESDLKDALSIDANNNNARLQYGSLLWKVGRKDEAKKMYADVLAHDPTNHFAMESLGYLARDGGDVKLAEEWFNKLAAAYPNDYVPHLALGDLHTATRDFARAEDDYQQAYKRAPKNAIVVANAANAAIEARKFDSAGTWLARATGGMQNEPKVMLERERYLFHTGKYAESAQLGRRVLEQLPTDRNASVYLGYALYDLGRYDDVLALVDKYANVLPKEPNFPLLAGHVHKQSQLLDEAVDDYTHAIERDPKMVEAYINRGYVLNDLQNAEQATEDFDVALKLVPNNGIAHLGLAFASLQLHKGKTALDQADTAAKLMGDSGAVHLARATAYRQMRLLEKAEKEYEVALKYAPDDLHLELALADTLYHLRRYSDSLRVLNTAMTLSPDDPLIYAEMAHATAQLHDRNRTIQYVEQAEKAGADQSSVLLATGDAFLTLGDRGAAMDRFSRALETPDADKVDVRLAIARVFAREGKWDDAKQQIALAFAESRVGEAAPVTADNLIEAANTFLSMNDFDLARRYYQRAADLGAADEVVAIGLANTYLATGRSAEAQRQLETLGSADENLENYDYTLAMANVYRQQHDNVRALTALAHANQLGGEDPVAERELAEVAGDEGLRLNHNWSVLTNLDVAPIFDDETMYMLDAKLFGVQNSTGSLPPPRSSLQTAWTSAYRFHQGTLPTVSGFFQIRNSRGQYSVPSETLILDRNTTDYSLNTGINPVLRLGRNTIQFNTGIQFTARRDAGSKTSAIELNQNLFRQFVYVSTNSFFNWIAVRGNAFHESGPFTNRSLSSRDLGARVEFVVGRPWGHTSMVTGYSNRDLMFRPLIREFFSTSTYAGVEHRFGERMKLTAVGEYIRAWRVQDTSWVFAQAMRPAISFQYQPTRRWTVDADFAYSRGEGFHAYDNMHSGFFISYVKPLHRSMADGSGSVPVEYPLQFSVGLQQEQFFQFTGHGQALFRPVFRLTLF